MLTSCDQEMVLAELCPILFSSLPRRDQRRKGVEYLRGLLEAPGRKSIRNIAALTGGPATEQSLHHFISDSTWDWEPVRQALAQYLVRCAPPQAWVIRPIVIPKAGEHSVGVSRRYSPALGQALNAQQAVGIWAASEELSGPVNWRLHLTHAWLDDDERRNRAAIPDGMDQETLGDCAVEAYLGMAARQDLPCRPVVLDARDMDALCGVRRLHAAGVPFLVRLNSTLRLVAVDPPLPGHPAGPMPVVQIMNAARDLRRPVAELLGGTMTTRTRVVAAVRVRPPVGACEIPAGPTGDLLLLGVGEIGQRWPTELWLTDMTDTPPAALLRWSRLLHRVDRDFTRIADRVGIRDFAGRSFTGWHRHVTLASAAHAVVALTQATARPTRQVS